jgi:hypothetical protein
MKFRLFSFFKAKKEVANQEIIQPMQSIKSVEKNSNIIVMNGKIVSEEKFAESKKKKQRLVSPSELPAFITDDTRITLAQFNNTEIQPNKKPTNKKSIKKPANTKKAKKK